MTPDFRQITWDEYTADDCRQILRLAVREDLGRGIDLTTVAIVSFEARGVADMVARRPGVVAGLPAVQLMIDEMQLDVAWESTVADGTLVDSQTSIARLSGSTRDLLTAERIMLNLVSRLSGIATLTRRYVDAIAGTQARVYDTRKTTPGWRRLEKYAVRCGGGWNHRTGLFDAVLIKDNHLAQAAGTAGTELSPAAAVTKAREFLCEFHIESGQSVTRPRMAQSPAPFPQEAEHRNTTHIPVPIEIEVDTLEQLASVLPLSPDIVLLDNMTVDQLRSAVQMRAESGASCELEASGGVTLESIREIAETGVDRISVGALTHSAVSLDIALDWRSEDFVEGSKRD